MEYITDRITYRCNACGHKFDSPDRCNHCNTSLCPGCHRAGSIVNVVEMYRMVSNEVLTKSELDKKNRKTGKPKKTKNPSNRIAELMELTK